MGDIYIRHNNMDFEIQLNQNCGIPVWEAMEGWAMCDWVQ